jgi:signal transduction histidine kinase
MLRQFLSWRIALAFLAIVIVSGTIFYSQYLARKIKREEKQRVEQWYQAAKFIQKTPDSIDTRFANQILIDQKFIPVIEADEKDQWLDWVNLDSASAIKNGKSDSNYIQHKLEKFKGLNAPLIYIDPIDSTRSTRYYYGHTRLYNEVRFYPLLQLLIVALFILITILSLRSSYRAVQNQVWAGMAKETAHQLGTPVSSLEGWVEMLKEKSIEPKIVQELEKDVDRLRLVSDRFGKIGSTPQLEETDIVQRINFMIDYMRRRAAGKILFSVKTEGDTPIIASISPPLFDWVIENLLKNALDAMEGKGSIQVVIRNEKTLIELDITDTGKGISKQNVQQVFKPGFTTKKRGWGLGLSLSKRIIETYHRGEIYVKHSELGKGTTFRIVLNK